MIEENLLHSLFREKGGFSWLFEVCADIWNIWRDGNDRVFRGKEREHSEVWSLIRFHVSV